MQNCKYFSMILLVFLSGCQDSGGSQPGSSLGGEDGSGVLPPPPPPPPPRYEACTDASVSSAQAALVSYGSQLRDACFFNTVNSYGTIESCQFDNETGRILARGTFYFTGAANNDSFSVSTSVSTLPNGVDSQFSSVVASTNYQAACREKAMWSGLLEGMTDNTANQ